MKEDFSVPKEYEEYSNAFYEKENKSKRDFVDFCLLAIELIDSNWDKRQGIAYQIAGTMQYNHLFEDSLLDGIVSEFGELELPDHHAAGNEEQVRKKWDKVKELVKEADEKFPKT